MNKNKFKGRGKIISALIVMLLTLAALTQQAFATSWSGQGSGTGMVGVATDKPTRYYNHSPMLWRVSLYVSSNEDGKIKETDTVERELKWVGEVIYYDREHMYSDKKAYNNAYVQTASSVSSRIQGESLFNAWSVLDFDEDGYHCHAPNMCTLSADGETPTKYTGGPAGRIIAVKWDAFDLFQYSDYGDFSYTDGLLKGSQAGEKTTEIINDITGYSLGFSNFWSNVNSAISGQVKDDLTRYRAELGDPLLTAKQYLLPAKDGQMNDKCLVDYALVIEPMVMYNTVRDFGLPTNDPSEGANFAWDAYYFALLNNNFGGVLKTDLGTYFGTTAARCHDTYKPDGQSHHGVICSSIDGAGSWAEQTPAIYAIRGGIALYTITRDTGIPIRYYNYDYQISEDAVKTWLQKNSKDPTTYWPTDEEILKALQNKELGGVPKVTVEEGSVPEGQAYDPKNDPKLTHSTVVAYQAPKTGQTIPPVTTPAYPLRIATNCTKYVSETPNTFTDKKNSGAVPATPQPPIIEVKIVRINPPQQTPMISAGSDMVIKTWDMTQLIKFGGNDFTNAIPSGGEATIHSKPPFDIPSDHDVTHSYDVSCEHYVYDSDGNRTDETEHSSDTDTHDAGTEGVEVYYGLNPSNSKHYTHSSKVTTVSGYTSPGSASVATNVGFVVPKKFYSAAETVKGSSVASFDVLKKDNNSYWVQYLAGEKVLGTSTYHKCVFDSTRVKAARDDEDVSNPFSWETSTGGNLSSAAFISHRDLLTNQHTLTVSGYMQLYATNSGTANYVKFMQNAGLPARISNGNISATCNTDYKTQGAHFNLGGEIKAAAFLKTNLQTSGLTAEGGGGDVSRPVWVVATWDQSCSHSSYGGSYNYIDKDKYNKLYQDMYNGGTHLVTKVDTPKVSFNPLIAVEGTTNGKWAGGISFNTDKIALSGNVVQYTNPGEKYTQSKQWINSSYATVGEKANNGGMVASYWFTNPTDHMTFNPSIAMAYDDVLADNNRSVWVLSEQARSINFYDALNIRLTYNTTATTNAKNGYSTIIESEFSTDKQDTDVKDVTSLPTMKASAAYKTKTAPVGGTVTAYVVLQDPEFAADKSAAQAANTAKLKQVSQNMYDLWTQFGGDVSVEMYTNMSNGSSTGSFFSKYNDPNNPLITKEQMNPNSKITTGWTAGQATTSSIGSWKYYALPGHKVENLYGNTTGETGKDISDTTKGGARKINGVTVQSASSLSGYQKTQLNEYNDHLTGLMYKQDAGFKYDKLDQDTGSLAIPANTTPYGEGDSRTKFSWYNEDYEGFVVAICEFSFSVKDNSSSSGSFAATTNFNSVYKSESDWRAPTNEGLKTDSGVKELKVDYSFGTLDLISSKGHTAIKDFQKKCKNYSDVDCIYGIGLELAGLDVSFEGTHLSDVHLFYQPTYFHVRGSVYDTAR